MTCEQATERLPWLLNGTLGEDEEREVREHLPGCRDCREALARTREAWAIFAQHVPAGDLVAYAAGEEPTGVDRGVLERHLLSCPQCAADLELVRTSRQLTEDEGVALLTPPTLAAPAAPAVQVRQARPAGSRWWRSSAVAAGLAGVIAATGWIHTAQQLDLARDAARTVPAAAARQESERVAALERQVGAGTQRIGELEKALHEKPAPAPALGLHAATVRTLVGGQRDAGSHPAVKIWAGTASALKLASGNDTGTRVEIRREPQGKVVLGHGDLRFDADGGGYVILIDAKALPPGRYTLRVLDSTGEAIESYALEVASGLPPAP